MLNKEDILRYLSEYKRSHTDKYHISKLGIFGSYARNEAGEGSDIDVVVGFDKPNLFNLSAIMLDLKEHFKTEVDVVALWDKMNPKLKKRIDRDAIYV